MIIVKVVTKNDPTYKSENAVDSPDKIKPNNTPETRSPSTTIINSPILRRISILSFFLFTLN